MMRVSLLAIGVLCLAPVLWAAGLADAVAIYAAYNLPVGQVDQRIVRMVAPRRHALIEITCRNLTDQPVTATMEGYAISSLDGTSPVDAGMLARADWALPAPVVLQLPPREMKTIAIDGLPPYYRVKANTPYLLRVDFAISREKETVKLPRIFPLTIAGRMTNSASEWVTNQGVAVRLLVSRDSFPVTARERDMPIIAELRNTTRDRIAFAGLPTLNVNIPDGGMGVERVEPVQVKETPDKQDPFILPPGATLSVPIAHGVFDAEELVYRLSSDGADYRIRPGRYHFDARVRASLGDPAGTVEWALPRFAVQLPNLGMHWVPIYAQNPDDGFIWYDGSEVTSPTD